MVNELGRLYNTLFQHTHLFQHTPDRTMHECSQIRFLSVMPAMLAILQGQTCLMAAAASFSYSCEAIVRCLLSSGADASATDNEVSAAQHHVRMVCSPVKLYLVMLMLILLCQPTLGFQCHWTSTLASDITFCSRLLVLCRRPAPC